MVTRFLPAPLFGQLVAINVWLARPHSFGDGEPTESSGTPRAASKPSAPRRRGSGSARRSNGGRAPRGANRAAVLRVLADRPGVSVAELSSAAAVAKPVLYNLLRTLEQRGEIAKEQLPSGSTGYRLAPEAPAEPANVVPQPVAEPS